MNIKENEMQTNNYNFSGNTFNGNSTGVINNYNEAPNNTYNKEKILSELQEIKKKVENSDELYDAITILSDRLDNNNSNNENISKTIKKHIKEFTGDMFTSLASTALIEFIKSFVH